MNIIEQNIDFVKAFFTTIILCLGVQAQAQISIKTEYITQSKYKDEYGNKMGGKGDMKAIHGTIQLPVSYKIDENKRITAWAISTEISYASMNNVDLSNNLCLPELLNGQIGLLHMRPISEKWSILAMLGTGLFTSDLNRISGKDILALGGVIFIKHAKPNLDWGAGVALNNVLGYPMIFPSLYFDWKLRGDYEVNVSVYSNAEISAKKRINEHLKLGIVAEGNGFSSVVKQDGKDMIFACQYSNAGFQTEFALGKYLTIPIIVGASISRDVYFTEKTIWALFNSKDEYPGFNVAPYISMGIKFGN
jgi:hypothetical protein